MNETSSDQKYVKEKIARQVLGVNGDTLRRWANANKITYIRTLGGNRLYNVDQFLKDNIHSTSTASIDSPSEQSTPSREPRTRKSETSKTDSEAKVSITSIQKVNSSEYFCYCRVSSNKQKDDLERQINEMQQIGRAHV